MNLHQALQLVRTKYLEEQTTTASPTADEYRQACERFPATMKTAHGIWVQKLARQQ